MGVVSVPEREGNSLPLGQDDIRAASRKRTGEDSHVANAAVGGHERQARNNTVS